ncbi:MAG: hypothetical protein K6D38_09310 [Pseudobutyrivibrio sp.]|nr:hypothetical protein [Pseudobutyrivibrio sp.]
MYLEKNDIEYPFSGQAYTNIGKEDNLLYDFYNLRIMFNGIFKAKDTNGVDSVAARLGVCNNGSSEIWLCYSFLLNDSEDFLDGHVIIEPTTEIEIEIIIEDYDISFSNNHRVRFHFILEDGLGRLIGRCNSICIDYNIFSGTFSYKILKKNSKVNRIGRRALDIRINKITYRREKKYPWLDEDMIYACVPIIIVNCSAKKKAFIINCLEFFIDDVLKIEGINDLTDVLTIPSWGARELIMIMRTYNYLRDDEGVYLDFTDIATRKRYSSEYTLDVENQMFIIKYSVIYIHDEF